MSNGTIVENGAAGGSVETKHNPERALVGKIARLPRKIREELNGRLDENEPGSEILPWVNALPGAKRALAKYFRGVPISDANLSQWRRIGYQRWVRKQEGEAEIRIMAEELEDFSAAAGEKLARKTATLAAARVLKLLQERPPDQWPPGELIKVVYATAALAKVEQNDERLKNEQTRVFQGNERLVLSWDKHLRDCVATAQRVLNDEIARARH
jgi:hypothetical protein